MGSTSRSTARAFFAFVFAFALASGLCAQNIIPSGQLGTEIQTLEEWLSHAELSAAERNEGLTRLARLLQLSGDNAAAATKSATNV